MKSLLLRYSRSDVAPSVFFLSCAYAVERLTLGRLKKFELLRRYLETNKLPMVAGLTKNGKLPAIEILFVCAGKDLELLPIAVEAALAATSQHELYRVTIVVPARDLVFAQRLHFPESARVTVLSESEKLPQSLDLQIRDVFNSRAGWVIQQVLKVLCVSDSMAPGVLVCDSDTILTLNRIWFDSAGNQILTPSWENTESYYKFLSQRGLGSIKPKYSFVSHHMLMQPRFMNEARHYVNWENLENLVADLIKDYDASNLSPFCIEFELYAQYMMMFKIENVRLVKWSNLSLTRGKLHKLPTLGKKYASVSLHDYLA